MSELVNFVKAYAEKNYIPYKQALRDASPTYKTRNEIKPEVVEPIKKIDPKIKPEEPTKFKRKNTTKKQVESITLKLKFKNK